MLEQSLDGPAASRPAPEAPPPLSSRLFHRLLEKLPAGAYLCDAEGLITYFNEHAARLWGRAPRLGDPADRFCGSFKLYSTDGAPIAHQDCWMALALRTRREYNGHEIVIERPDGSRITALAHANPLHDEAGALLGAVNVLVDISDQKRAEHALAEADRAKSEFLATVSHEIRTPLNAIIGYLDLLELEVAGPLNECQRVQVGRTREASRHLLSLINEVLDFSRLEAGQMEMRREARPAGGASAAALAVTQPLAAARGLELRYRAAGARLLYVGDEDRVRQMLINLLSNAIKFSEAGERIDLTVGLAERPDIGLAPEATSARWVCFRVRDRGIGIPPDQLERIFEPFVQVEAARTRKHGGTGLGLTISRRLARLMGGDLTVESTLGVGSVFTLWLPSAGADEEAAEPVGPVPAAGRAEGGPVFAAVGQGLLTGLDAILLAYGERLRAGSVPPHVRSLSTPRLGDHTAALLADLAVRLRGLGEPRDPTEPVAVVSEIQRLCAVEHGRQRGRLGWIAADLEAEYAALEEELVRRVRALDAGPQVERVIETLRASLAQARSHGLRGLAEVAASP